MNKKEICPSLSVLFSQCCTEKKERLQLPAEPSRTQRDIRSIISGLHIHTQSHIHVYVTSSPKGMPKKTSAHLLIFVSGSLSLSSSLFFFVLSVTHTHTDCYISLSLPPQVDGWPSTKWGDYFSDISSFSFTFRLFFHSYQTLPLTSSLSLTPRFRFTCEINVSGVNMKSSGNDDSI